MVDSVVDKLVADAEYFVTVDVETIAGSSSDTSRTSKLYTLQIKKRSSTSSVTPRNYIP